MRLPRLQLRIRTLLILVGLVATLLGAELTRRRAIEYRLMANDYRIEADYHARSVAGSKKIQQMWLELAKKREDQANDPNETREAGVYSEELRNFFRRSAAEASRKADIEGALALYHEALQRKYERAVGRPWVTVPPDPPEPASPPEVEPPSSSFLTIPANPSPSEQP